MRFKQQKVSDEVLKEGLEIADKLGAILVEARGGIWATTSIEETPQITLDRWSIRELADGDRHFVGYNITEHEGRVSSKIVEFDKEKLIGKTRSGRVYKLTTDGQGVDSDAEYVWNYWARVNAVEPNSWKLVDLSKE